MNCRRAFLGLVFGALLGCGTPTSPPTNDDTIADTPAPAVEPEPAVSPEVPQAVDPPEPDRGGWSISRRTNPLDDSETVVAMLSASEGTGGLLGEPVRLIARCQSNRTEFYVNWQDYLGDDDNDVRATGKRVTYRFPPAEARTEMWNVSTDNDSTFVARAIPFLRVLVENERLVMQTTPYNEAPTTAIFELKGARRVLEPLAETCNWILDAGEVAQARRGERRRRLSSLINSPITRGLGAVRFPDGEVVAELENGARLHFQPGIAPATVIDARSGQLRDQVPGRRRDGRTDRPDRVQARLVARAVGRFRIVDPYAAAAVVALDADWRHHPTVHLEELAQVTAEILRRL